MLSTEGVAPTDRPDASQQRDAIGKGLGRAVLWARACVWTERDVLLEACLNDQRYDSLFNDPRGPWLWQIMDAAGVIDDFRESILDAMRRIDDETASVQLCQFCVFYARRGDDRFRHRLREIVTDKPVPSCPGMGEEQLVELEPEAGLLLIARQRGSEFVRRGWEWDDLPGLEAAVEALGHKVVADLLDQEAKTSADVRRYRDGWLAALAEEHLRDAQPRQSHEERMRQVTLDDVLRDAESGVRLVGRGRGWGMHACEDDLSVILDRILAGGPPAVMANYLRVFSNRPTPTFDQRLLGLLWHEDEEVRRRAFTAVAQNAHPQIRRFALDHAAERINEPNFLELFVRNFRPGDEELFMRHLSLPDDSVERHDLLMDLKKVLRENPEASCRDLALVSYGANPCGGCRYDAVKLLLTQNVAPAWLIEECRLDSETDAQRRAGDLP